jgi:hypothetical protein
MDNAAITSIQTDLSLAGVAKFVSNGQTYKAEIAIDDTMGAPWDEHCGHGPVSEWTTRTKAPGERILCADRGSYRYYNIAEATKTAKHDGWDAAPYTKCTKGQKAARAVEADFKNLRLWATGEWWWVGVIVTQQCSCCDAFTGPSRSLWGIESTAGNYLAEVALELVEEIQTEAAIPTVETAEAQP